MNESMENEKLAEEFTAWELEEIEKRNRLAERGNGGCTGACFAMPACSVCGLRKKPHGRDAAPAFANSLCGYECPGYEQEPRSGHRWPEENE